MLAAAGKRGYGDDSRGCGTAGPTQRNILYMEIITICCTPKSREATYTRTLPLRRPEFDVAPAFGTLNICRRYTMSGQQVLLFVRSYV